MVKTRSSSSLLLIAVLLWTVLLPTQAQTPAPGYLAGGGNLPLGFPAGLGNVIATAGGKSHDLAAASAPAAALLRIRLLRTRGSGD